MDTKELLLISVNLYKHSRNVTSHIPCTPTGRKEYRVASQVPRASAPVPPHLYFIQLPYKYSIFHPPRLSPSRLYSP
jgi:hypothetical protein